MDFSKKRKAEENGNASPALTAEDARKLLEVLSQEQLMDILESAVVRHSDVLESVRSVVNRDTSLRKLFVRGLGSETTSESLRSVFSAFGELDEAIVIFDKATAKSKGYGFVTFKNADSALLALRLPSKKIDGRIAVTQLASANSNSNSVSKPQFSYNSDVSARKIYVGSVPFEISAERLLSHFMMYGEIEEGPLGFDKSTGKSRGFAFFVYRNESAARAALVDPIKTIDGHQVACKLAVDNNKKPKSGLPDSPAAVTVPYGAVPPPQQQQQAGGMFYGGSFGSGYGPPPQPQLRAAGEFGGRMAPPSGGRGYPEGSQFSLGPAGGSAAAHHRQQPPMPPMPRVPGMYQGLHHYY